MCILPLTALYYSPPPPKARRLDKTLVKYTVTRGVYLVLLFFRTPTARTAIATWTIMPKKNLWFPIHVPEKVDKGVNFYLYLYIFLATPKKLEGN
jgi:hypothetical protein